MLTLSDHFKYTLAYKLIHDSSRSNRIQSPNHLPRCCSSAIQCPKWRPHPRPSSCAVDWASMACCDIDPRAPHHALTGCASSPRDISAVASDPGNWPGKTQLNSIPNVVEITLVNNYSPLECHPRNSTPSNDALFPQLLVSPRHHRVRSPRSKCSHYWGDRGTPGRTGSCYGSAVVDGTAGAGYRGQLPENC